MNWSPGDADSHPRSPVAIASPLLPHRGLGPLWADHAPALTGRALTVGRGPGWPVSTTLLMSLAPMLIVMLVAALFGSMPLDGLFGIYQATEDQRRLTTIAMLLVLALLASNLILGALFWDSNDPDPVDWRRWVKAALFGVAWFVMAARVAGAFLEYIAWPILDRRWG